ncbi:deoxynucleotide monophosphate kinase [bacterium]|nr:MAG: deoxynucleotide monophosphate kinase [bacterium]
MPPILIGLAGPARSGKDSVANIIKDQTMAMNIAFAEPIKKMLSALLDPITPNARWEPVDKEQQIPRIGKSYRQLIQTLGTEWGRDLINPDIWLNLAMTKADYWLNLNSHVTITDVRFANEADAIRQRGGYIWHIDRPNIQIVNPHASEQQQLGHLGDIIIDNSGTLGDLRSIVNQQLEALL